MDYRFSIRGVGGGASCPGWFILPSAQDLGQTVSSVNFYCTIILEYLVVRDVNIISVKLRCLHLTFSSVILVRGVGGKLTRLVYLAPPPAQDLGQTVSSVNSYCTIILEYLVVRDVNIISDKLRCGLSILYPRGGGQAVQAGLSCPPPPRIWVKQCHQSILIHHNLGIFSCMRYKHYFGQTEMLTSNVQVWLSLFEGWEAS